MSRLPIRRMTGRRSGGSVIAALTLAVLILPREPAPGELRLGQKVMVDDGSCPPGQVKEVSGAKLTTDGVTRTARCVSRR